MALAGGEGQAPQCGYFLNLDAHHNKYAARPLPPSLLNNENTTHYEYNDGSGYWEQMEGVATDGRLGAVGGGADDGVRVRLGG